MSFSPKNAARIGCFSAFFALFSAISPRENFTKFFYIIFWKNSFFRGKKNIFLCFFVFLAFFNRSFFLVSKSKKAQKNLPFFVLFYQFSTFLDELKLKTIEHITDKLSTNFEHFPVEKPTNAFFNRSALKKLFPSI